MVSRAKLYSQLDRLKDELKERLIPHLEKAVSGKNDLVFCTAEFNTLPELKRRADTETESLVRLGRQILVLEDKLGESSDGTAAQRLCWYCRTWGDATDHHGKSAQGLAAQFLEEVRNS